MSILLLPPILMFLVSGCGTTSPRSNASGGMTTGVGSEDHFALALKEQMPALLASNKVPGAVVSCIKNGEVAWTKAFGLADLRTSSGFYFSIEHSTSNAPVSALRYLRCLLWNPRRGAATRLLP
jgi:hypothetical protein